jgi:hypothetical protein
VGVVGAVVVVAAAAAVVVVVMVGVVVVVVVAAVVVVVVVVVVAVVVCNKMCTALPISLTTAVNKATGVNLYIIGSANANCTMVFSSERIWYESSP